MPRVSKESKDKQRLKSKLKYREKKARLVNLFGSKCSMCNNSFPDCCYDFHHLDPLTKDTKISQLIHYNDDRMIEEAKKCIMVCANCHRIIHAYND